jgi:diguanylate cyclase (GGDEF)-like protein
LLAAAAQQRSVALLFVNIDRFKTVNDAFGPRLGDRMLQLVGTRIADCVERVGLAGRMGADEFAVVLDGLGHPAEATSVARRVLEDLQRPYDVDGRRVYASASVGIAAYPGDGVHAATLFQKAGIALTQAKRDGGNRLQVFQQEMQAAAARRLQFETDLRGALERREFVLRYQPRYDAASGSVVGFEALLRWDHPGQGMIPPGEFIPILEETGEIAAVGEWVLRSVCEQIRAWELAKLQPLPVAVNLSASQFRHRSLDVAIARVIAETGVSAGLLELELTESSLMQDPEDAVRTLRHLESFGVKLSVDDFGTGYSSLAYLKRFPLDALRIDRAFVHDAPTNADDAAITTAIIQLGHALGLRIVAEGVETNEQRDLLLALGCDEMQGFLFARPAPASAIDALLEKARQDGMPRPSSGEALTA